MKQILHFFLRSTAFKLCVITCLLVAPYMASAVPAPPYSISVRQPDGTSLTIRLHGDEYFHYTTTTDGYVIVQGPGGFYYHASYQSDGSRKLMSVRAANPDQRTASQAAALMGATKTVSSQTIASARAKTIRSKAANGPSKAVSTIGKNKSLVILAAFSDVPFQYKQSYFYDILNTIPKSAKQYFKDSSYDQYDPEFVVVGPVNLPKSMKYYGGNDAQGNDKNPQQMCIDAVKAASNSGVNMADFDTDNDGIIDNVFIFYAGENEAEGGGDDTVWPHRWAVNSQTPVIVDGVRLDDYACTSEYYMKDNTPTPANIGTFCHEFGHVLGLFDMYDVDYKENGENVALGVWSIMASGSYLDESRTPPSYNALERSMAGWIDLTEIKDDGNYTLAPLNTGKKAYIFQTKNKDESFLIENRALMGWDVYLPASGMLVYHVDMSQNNFVGKTALKLWQENKVNAYTSHQCMDLLEANGRESTSSIIAAGNPFPGKEEVTTLDYAGEANSLAWNKTKTFKMSDIAMKGIDVSFSFLNYYTSSTYPSISVQGQIEAGTVITLTASNVNPEAVATKWLIDGTLTEDSEITLSAGEHELRLEITGKDGSDDVVIKYVNVK